MNVTDSLLHFEEKMIHWKSSWWDVWSDLGVICNSDAARHGPFLMHVYEYCSNVYFSHAR